MRVFIVTFALLCAIAVGSHGAADELVKRRT